MVTYRDALRSVGKGWHPLIRTAYRFKPSNIDILQVKEKFGALRIYSYPGDPTYNKVISALVYISNFTCEWCGRKGNPDVYNHWVLTLCKDCMVERRNRNDSTPR